jgi:predicted CXXCH cytochrome family protein
MSWQRRGLLLLALLAAALPSGAARADRVSDIRNTKHNLSAQSGNTVRAVTEDQVCVFCHTPHGAEKAFAAPLWNRKLSTSTYIPYSSSSLAATGLDQPGGSSKLCLSCHDGTLAIGAVNVLNGAQANGTTPLIQMQGTAPNGTMPPGPSGAQSGFTRLLGTDLRSDHPISFTYDDALAAADSELRRPGSTSFIGNRTPGGSKPLVPLEKGQLQCTSCHDPHIRDTSDPNIKFLRLNRLQTAEPSPAGFNKSTDLVCLACHDKAGWVGSAHASSLVATETYAPSAAALREFPANLPVWQAGCLNCHDPHTVQGSRHLLREGTDSLTVPKTGGNAALEETCYQCHSATGAVLNGQGGASFAVPDVKSDFTSLRHMPIAQQPETHDIGTGPGPHPGSDFIESQSNLGKGAPQNRHAECTDCHNPHRVIKKRAFNDIGTVPDAAGTHTHDPATQHSNIASGVLKGGFGVEPLYGAPTFLSPPISYAVKRGNPAPGASNDVNSPYVTREYQICLKCHSDYAYDTPPRLGAADGGTPPGTNNLTRYTNQAMEFQPPLAARGEPGANHRSWHPVIDATGRTPAIRRASANNWLAPFNGAAAIGNQTMYCSDCHGSDTAPGTVIPAGGENGKPWGPHGSTNNFILKGNWSATTGTGAPNDLCFKCHDYQTYATGAFKDGGAHQSGFGGPESGNLHGFHADKIGRMRCTWCHVAVPHGWKNKAFLVNLNDVGPEAGLPAGTQVRNNTTAPFNQEPYYLNSVLKVRTFATSGTWRDTNCGSAGPPGNGIAGKDWMEDSNENCKNAP